MFSDIIGNDKLKKELIHSVEINKTSHSIILANSLAIIFLPIPDIPKNK